MFLGEVRMLRHRELAVVIAYGRAGTPAAAVAQQRHVFARRQSLDCVLVGEHSELDEVISAPAGAELRPRPILVLLRHRADGPIRVQHFMLAALLERGAGRPKYRAAMPAPLNNKDFAGVLVTDAALAPPSS